MHYAWERQLVVNTCFSRHSLRRNIGRAAVIQQYTFVSTTAYPQLGVSMSAKSPEPPPYFHTKPRLSSADKCISTLSHRTAIGNYFSILFFCRPGQQHIANTPRAVNTLSNQPTCECTKLWEITALYNGGFMTRGRKFLFIIVAESALCIFSSWKLSWHWMSAVV